MKKLYYTNTEKALNSISALSALFVVSPVIFQPIRSELVFSVALLFSLVVYFKKFPIPNGLITIFTCVMVLQWLHHTNNPQYFVALARLGQIDWFYGLLWPLRALITFFIVGIVLNTIVTARFFLVALSVSPLISLVLIAGHTTSSIFMSTSHEVFNSLSGRFNGLHSNPNYFAFSILGCLSVSLFALSNSARLQISRRKAYVIYFSAVVSVALLALSSSRGALIALAGTGVVIVSSGLLYFFSKKIGSIRGSSLVKIRSLVLASSFFLFLFGGGLLVIVSETASARILDLFSGSGGGRYAIWEAVFQVFREATLADKIFGLGVGYFPSFGLTGKGNWIHNSYLTIAFDYGLFGVLLLFVVIFVVARRAYKSSFHYSGILLLPLLLFALSNDIFYNIEFWIFTSIIFNLNNITESSYTSAPRQAQYFGEKAYSTINH
ncbi:O-antigen ligase family protein [Sulfitobacter pontiacus]|uniref:O-antigen ligase family protein n=1 Tax=Sulfitobacter pontiacus TaxID=60137 RepID=UPI0030ED36E4